VRQLSRQYFDMLCDMKPKRTISSLIVFSLMAKAWEYPGFTVRKSSRRISTNLHMAKESEIETQGDKLHAKDRVVYGELSRRQALGAALTTGLVFSSRDIAFAKSSNDVLEDVTIGDGKWIPLSKSKHTSSSPNMDPIVPITFVTYCTRFLINYDKGASVWWKSQVNNFSLLSKEEQSVKLGRSFGCFARSVQMAFEEYLSISSDTRKGYENLLQIFLQKYGATTEAKRQIGLLFAILPPQYQPTEVMTSVIFQNEFTSPNLKSSRTNRVDDFISTEGNLQMMNEDVTSLLPNNYQSQYISNSNAYGINPPITFFEIGVDNKFGQSATATFAGPLSSLPLKREQPDFPIDIYALLGISGGVGCAITHSVVIPLDVVKTRMQTDPMMSSGSMLDSASNILDTEGLSGLVLGAQATIAGYLWYGISVYPSYSFFKRWMTQSLLSPEVAMLHINDIALVAGALAAVIASFGLTPLEAARIRTVAEPKIYREKGLFGTLQAISLEDPELGWKKLYAGFPSLVTRQVIFGSVKFFAFEQACETIFKLWPILEDATWTSLMVSLVGGGFSGALSSVVSQPADSVLTYVARSSDNGNLGFVEGSILMVEKEGVKSLFRGLGSRCIWAGSIIAGQFLLYDVFRALLNVSKDDLSQVFEVVISGAQTIN